MNLVVLSGRLATEPSLKYLKESGIPVSKFNLAVQKEYYKNDELTNKTIKIHNDGKKYIHTGDMGYITENGVVYVKDRIKRMIVRYDGFKIYPSSIEDVIMKSNLVDSCAVIGYKEQDLGVVTVAYISIKEQYKDNVENCLKEIMKFCIENLAERAVPYKFEVIDYIPVKESGKVDITKLEQDAKVKSLQKK